MHKVVYWIGVYSICIVVHECIHDLQQEWNKTKREKESEQEKKKRAIGIQPDSSRKPVNKIGFAIESV